MFHKGLCDAVEKGGGVLQIPITMELRIAVSAARQRLTL